VRFARPLRPKVPAIAPEGSEGYEVFEAQLPSPLFCCLGPPSSSSR
jgi:hypothetical protein